MKNMHTSTMALVTMLALATGPVAFAQPPKEGEKPAAEAAAAAGHAAPAVPKPAPENDIIKKSSGSWSCEGVGKGPDGQEMKYKTTWTVKPALGGHWYNIIYKRSKMGPMPPFEGNATVGFNVALKKYVLIGFDNFGSWINLSSTDGALYTGDGAPMGKVTPAKFTFSSGKDKKGAESDKLFDVTLEFGASSSTENCKK